MSTDGKTLEEIIAAHAQQARSYISDPAQCACGWTSKVPIGRRVTDYWAAHVAAEIRKAFGVVELPEESKDEDWRIDGYKMADDDEAVIPDYGTYVIERTGPALVLNVKVDGDYYWRDIEPDEARTLAAALLAAADHATAPGEGE